MGNLKIKLHYKVQIIRTNLSDQEHFFKSLYFYFCGWWVGVETEVNAKLSQS